LRLSLLTLLLVVTMALPARAETGAHAVDGTTLVMTDGRQIVLAGVYAPMTNAPLLEKLVTGQDLKIAGRRTDRYGRLLATVALPDGRDLASALLEAGAAQFFPATTSDKKLAIAESSGRRKGTGVWQQPETRILTAEEAEKHTNAWRIVEGTVTSVTLLGSTTFVNFGTDWKTDFTLRMSKRVALKMQSALQTGHKLRARGWLAWRNGPEIEITSPLQVDIDAN